MSPWMARAAYALEERLRRQQTGEPPFASWRKLALYHASTPEHLAIFLEQVLHENPSLRVGVQSCLEDVTRDLPEWRALASAFDLQPSVPERADGALLLHSPTAASPRARATKTRFRRDSSPAKFIIDGDATIWPGDVASRARRKALRWALAQVAGRRDDLEERLLAARLRPDPGLPAEGAVPRLPPDEGPHWRRLLDDPVPLEQDDVTGAVRRRLELAPEDPALYEHAYHGMRFIAHRRDWAEDERVWMGRRWANMAAAGVKEGGATRPSPRALDAGCGSGLLAGLLHQRGYKVDAFDVSRTAIEKAARRFPGVRFVAGELLDCGLDEGAYQLVALSHVIEHVRDDAGFLRSLARFLAPGGHLYLETTWMDLAPLRARPDWVRQRDHYREHTKPSLRALLHEAGYEVLAHEDSWRGGAGEPYQFLLAAPRADEGAPPA